MYDTYLMYAPWHNLTRIILWCMLCFLVRYFSHFQYPSELSSWKKSFRNWYSTGTRLVSSYIHGHTSQWPNLKLFLSLSLPCHVLPFKFLLRLATFFPSNFSSPCHVLPFKFLLRLATFLPSNFFLHRRTKPPLTLLILILILYLCYYFFSIHVSLLSNIYIKCYHFPINLQVGESSFSESCFHTTHHYLTDTASWECSYMLCTHW